MSTFCCKEPIDFSKTEIWNGEATENSDLKVYTCRTYYINTATKQPRVDAIDVSTKVVAAETGLLFKGTEGTTYFMTKATEEQTPDDLGENWLVAITENGSTISETDGDKSNFMFYQNAFWPMPTAGTFPRGKAYLQITTDDLVYYGLGDNAKRENVEINFNEATAIKATKQAIDDDSYYTLSGTRVETPTKGIYIRNHHKVVIK